MFNVYLSHETLTYQRETHLGIRKTYIEGSHLGNQENTRCLGNYLVKGGYREFEELAASTAEPIIAEPEIHGSIELDESCRFLLLMSRGLYKSLEEATGTDQVNKELALIAVEQVIERRRRKSSLNEFS